jgi:molecular chaperone GrpE
VTQDPDRHHRDEDGERVVVRNRRRIDPTTGEVRVPDSEVSSEPGARPGAGAAPAEPAVADAQVAELTAEVAERTADLQRLSAEYANYRRRVERDRESVLVNARAQFVGELLTVLDDIDRAGQHGDLAGPFKSVADKLVSVVQKLGLEPFGTVGEPFDPSVHEAVQHELAADDGPTVTILSAVLRRGYRIGDRILRPAMVTVADTADDGTATESSNGTDPAAVGTEEAPESVQPHAGPA